METNQPRHFNGLDHLRALAITLVFFFHYFILSGGEPTWLPDVASFGWTGVDLFFVLSGFLIASQLFEPLTQGNQPLYKDFFRKRFFRILPAYLFTLALYFSLPFFCEKEALPALWRFLSFTQNFGLNLKDSGTFSHAWSLCVEEHFYLFLPISLFLFQKVRRLRASASLLLLLFILGFAFRLYSYQHLYLPYEEDELSGVYWYKYVYYPTYNRLDGLLVGVAIAALYKFRENWWCRMSHYGYAMLLTGLIFLTAAYFLCEDQMSFSASIFGFPMIAFGYGLLVMGALSPRTFLYTWKSRWTTRLATLSYALYLTHKGMIHLTHQLFAATEIDAHLLLLVSVVGCIILAMLVNAAIEKPFIKLGKRFASSASLAKPGKQ